MSIARVDVFIGQSAHAMLGSPEFLAAWRSLHAKCPHATGFQAPGFVRSWYDVYRTRWRPVIVQGNGPEGELAGLWLLAHDPAMQALVHAGAHQAEYHTWLTLPGTGDEFVVRAFAALVRRLPFRSLRFRYLPAVSLADKLDGLPALKNRLVIRRHSRPLARLDPSDIKASFAKKSNRSRFNRIKKLGKLEFRRVTEAAEFERVFDELVACYDFRQGAVNDVTPFREDPLKRRFHAAVFAAVPEEAHLTVTYLDERAIAALWGTVSGSIVHLGMLIHSPLLGEHSPGKLHVMQLSNLLLDEGKNTLDLTPGGDPWKERFANAHDEVAEAILYRSVWTRRRADLLDRLLRWTKRCATRVGLSPTYARATLARLRRARPAALLRRARNWASEQREFRVYRAERVLASGFARDARVRTNALPDLLEFEPGESWQTRHAFLSGALSRLERGESVYTINIENRLALFGWLVRNQTKSFMSEVQQSLALPSGSAALYDYYAHPAFRGRGLYRAMIGHMLREVFTNDATRYAYISVLADNLPSRHVIETLGFEYQGSFYWTCRFGSATKWASRELMPPDDSDA